MEHNDNFIYNIVKTTLLSLDNVVLIDSITNTNKIIKSIISFNLYQLIDILINTVYNNICVECLYITKHYHIVIFTKNENIILTLYLFICSINHFNLVENKSNFDCNMIVIKNTGFNINNNINVNINYLDIYNRNLNKKFCYISNNLYYVKNILLNRYNLKKNNSYIISKLFYAIKLIKNGWIMDEFILKDNSWTINYYNIYKSNINIIKFSNNDCCVDSKCKYCNKIYNDNDIVFNMNDKFIHFECLFNKLI